MANDTLKPETSQPDTIPVPSLTEDQYLTLQEKAYARAEIWKNVCAVVGMIDTVRKGSDSEDIVNVLRTVNEIGRIFETIKQTHAALREYFQADETADLLRAPMLECYIKQALALSDDAALERDLEAVRQYRQMKKGDTP
jgi:hypothetical protein